MQKVFVLLLVCGCSGGNMMPKPMTTPFAITILDRTTQQPISGAKVAVDDKKGKRVEGTTNATGVATLDVDWTQAPMTMTAYSPDHALASYLGLTKNATFQMTLGSNATTPPTGTIITGNILHKNMDSDYVTLSASVHAGYFQDSAASYTLDVYDTKAFSLYALDWTIGGPKTPSKRGVAQTFLKWAQVDAAAPTAGANVDIDFTTATPLTSVKQTGSLAIPANSMDGLTQSVGYVTVTDNDSGFSSFLGAPTLIDVNAASTGFDYNLEFVQPANITHPLTQYAIQTQAGSYTVKVDAAWPTDGAKVNDLLDIATVTKGPLPLTLSQAPTFVAAGGDSDSFMMIESNNGTSKQRVLWYVYGPAGTPLITPAPPTGIDLDVVLPPASLTGQIITCSPAQATVCTRYSVSEPFAITR